MQAGSHMKRRGRRVLPWLLSSPCWPTHSVVQRSGSSAMPGFVSGERCQRKYRPSCLRRQSREIWPLAGADPAAATQGGAPPCAATLVVPQAAVGKIPILTCTSTKRGTVNESYCEWPDREMIDWAPMARADREPQAIASALSPFPATPPLLLGPPHGRTRVPPRRTLLRASSLSTPSPLPPPPPCW